jgi:Fe-S oxidoreductase
MCFAAGLSLTPIPAIAYAEPEFAGWEQGLLGILIVASIAGFWARFRFIWQRIATARRDAGFALHPLGTRIVDFVWEVMCQARVIRERPLPGLAHAFVFWGFCAFALVSLNHFASGFGIPFLDSESPVGSFYLLFAAGFGVLVTAAITALAVRRFLIRPIWLGEALSYTSGVVALLIVVLMLTYIGGFFVRGTEPTAKALWWAHTVALLVFLPLIPHTKHLHLVLSPFTVFLSRGQFSAIPALTGDEDYGLVAGRDVTKLVALQAYSCVECGRCTEHCPAANTGKELSPKQLVLGMRDYLNALGTGSEQPLLGEYMSQRAVFQCTTCGSCEYQCPVGIEHLPVFIGLRRGAVNTGTWEDDYGTKLFLALERNGNSLGMSSTERDRFIQKQQFPIYDGTQEYCLWLGCMGAYDPAGREIVASLARVMSYLGTSFGVLRKEKCSGDPVRRLGNDLLFEELARQNLATLEQSKVRKLISICPHCVRTISTDWKQYGTPPPIEHHSEFLARHLYRLPQSPGAPNIVYHDPCYLGRYRGIYDEPRSVVAHFGRLMEPPRARRRSFCCGAGGGLAFLGEETGGRVSHARAGELAATGATIVGAACPFCNTMFRDALVATCASPPQLLDIAQLAAMSLTGVSADEDHRRAETSAGA